MNGFISRKELRSIFCFFSDVSYMMRSSLPYICFLLGFFSGYKNLPHQAFLHYFKLQSIDYSELSWIKNAQEGNEFSFAKNEKEVPAVNVEFVPFVLTEVKYNEAKKSAFNEVKKNKKTHSLTTLRKIYEKTFDQLTDQRKNGELANINVISDPIEVSKIEISKSSAIQLVEKNAEVSVTAIETKDLTAQPETFEKTNEVQLTSVQYLDHSKNINSGQEINKKNVEPVKAMTQTPPLAELESYNLSPSLNQDEKIKLSNLLLAENLKTQQKIVQNNNQNIELEARRLAALKPIYTVSNPIDEQPTFVKPDTNQESYVLANKSNKSKNQVGCDVLNSHVFMKPQGGVTGGLDTQICPEKIEWISIDGGSRGWVKVEGAEHLPTLTRHPAPNGGGTLLMDQNALAYVSIKTGVHVVKGAGMVSGVVPSGYKIEFLGRAEETQYFEMAGKKYFIILNAEPGAGVVELQSEINQNENSTVFTPVLEDTVTYLDLSLPEHMNLGIQVDKNKAQQEKLQSSASKDLSGLMVGVSTQKNIQGITLNNGYSQLKNVNVVNGFPIYVDVSSKYNGLPSYTYRYELNPVRSSQTKDRNFIVKQEDEKNIEKWLKQVKLGLSDQSAMVIGYFNKKRLDGFKKLHYAQTISKTSHLGFEPLSYSILWDDKISQEEPLEGDVPRFMSIQVPEGLSQAQLLNEKKQVEEAHLIPVSPRIIHVISD